MRGILSLLVLIVININLHAAQFTAAEEIEGRSSPPPSYQQEDETLIPLAAENNTNINDNINLLTRIENMQKEMQELRGQLEQQGHILALLQKQSEAEKTTQVTQTHKANQQAMELMIEPSLRTTPTVNTDLDSEPKLKKNRYSLHTNPVEEQISYLAAYELVKTKQFDNALSAMQLFVQNYPQSGYTANAQYWLGELYLVKNNYTDAMQHFNIVLKYFPNSSKTAASTLKIAYALIGLGKLNDARNYLQQVIKYYPDTSTAELATAKLALLKSNVVKI